MRDLSQLWNARIILEDGSIWRATSFGAEGETAGELVFNTALTGYQEVLTDPSYAGQVVVMTSPLIGNYGVNVDDEESRKLHLRGFVVREASLLHSNFRATESLGDYLKRHQIVALEGVDTRALTRRIRDFGAMRCFMTTQAISDDALAEKLSAVPELTDQDFIADVSRSKKETWNDGFSTSFHADLKPRNPSSNPALNHANSELALKVVAYDFGAKDTIFRSLKAVGCDLTIVPFDTSAADVIAMAPDGVFLSNGPGDPRRLTKIVTEIKGLVGKVPIFGICLGHQILALALGADIVKMKFGHHGSNHPVKNLKSGAIEITAQNHGFAVTAESLEAVGAEATHINLNDNTVAGLAATKLRAFSVQYHPEASPGPHDSAYLFGQFVEAMIATEGRATA
ncbi:MAG: glutamine-hydrolyzing carbamoyl-phosphate synthase small subunit [Planctomycetota bacterium]